jgi:hypothetical protein
MVDYFIKWIRNISIDERHLYMVRHLRTIYDGKNSINFDSVLVNAKL